jgi:hypothetical protein
VITLLQQHNVQLLEFELNSVIASMTKINVDQLDSTASLVTVCMQQAPCAVRLMVLSDSTHSCRSTEHWRARSVCPTAAAPMQRNACTAARHTTHTTAADTSP